MSPSSNAHTDSAACKSRHKYDIIGSPSFEPGNTNAFVNKSILRIELPAIGAYALSYMGSYCLNIMSLSHACFKHENLPYRPLRLTTIRSNTVLALPVPVSSQIPLLCIPEDTARPPNYNHAAHIPTSYAD